LALGGQHLNRGHRTRLWSYPIRGTLIRIEMRTEAISSKRTIPDWSIRRYRHPQWKYSSPVGQATARAQLGGWGLHRVARWIVCSVAVAAALVGAASPAGAMSWVLNPAGHQDFVYGVNASYGDTQNGNSAESRVFHTPDGIWWAILGTSGSDQVAAGEDLYRLVDHDWQLVLRLPGADGWSKSDTLFDESSNVVYVALRDPRGVTGNPRVSQLYKLSYDPSTTSWALISGPTTITTAAVETLTIAKDSLGQLWSAFRSGTSIRVGHTTPGGTKFSWSTLPVPAVTTDDYAVVTSFGTAITGAKIGVMWGDQVAQVYRFAWRNDADAFTSPWNVETAYGNGVGGCPTPTSTGCGDDHINIKVLGDDIYVAIKISSQDFSTPDPNDPLLVLIHRDVLGVWSALSVAPMSQKVSRPIVLIAPSNDRIYFVAEAMSKGLRVWESSLALLSFNATAYTSWSIVSAGRHPNPTSTKQPVDSNVGGLVEATSSNIYRYWHNEFLP
jgi:hypothetical protein